MNEKGRIRDRVDIGFSEQRALEARAIQEMLRLSSVQDVARVAIAYAARREVKLEVSDLKGEQLYNTLKGSELDQSGAISTALHLYYPDRVELDSQRNLCLEYLMNEGVRLLKEAVDEGSITSLANLMPERERTGA